MILFRVNELLVEFASISAALIVAFVLLYVNKKRQDRWIFITKAWNVEDFSFREFPSVSTLSTRYQASENASSSGLLTVLCFLQLFIFLGYGSL